MIKGSCSAAARAALIQRKYAVACKKKIPKDPVLKPEILTPKWRQPGGRQKEAPPGGPQNQPHIAKPKLIETCRDEKALQIGAQKMTPKRGQKQ